MPGRISVSTLLLLGLVFGCSESASKRNSDPVIDALAAERRKAIAEGRMAPPPEPFEDRNTNPRAYTVDGGRRDDDPPPAELPAEGRGRDGVANVEITDINHADNVSYCSYRIWEIARPQGNKNLEGRFTSTRLNFGGVTDLKALAKLIDFGEVTKLDESARTIHVKASADRMPQIFPKVSTQGDDPNFYRDNLANLTHWNSSRR